MNSNDDQSRIGDENELAAGEAAVAESEAFKMSLDVAIDDVGPCRKHVRVRVPRDDIQHYYDEVLGELSGTAAVPGFRVGHVPKKLVERRFRQELSDQVKQKVLIESLEQLSEDNRIEPISEPDLDVENMEIPEEGDFEYEFDVEVRPEFELPDYEGLTIERPARTVSEEDVDRYMNRFLSQFGQLVPHDDVAEPDDFVTVKVNLTHKGEELRELPEFTAQLRPILRFQDAELERFDELMSGVKAGETREADLTVSQEAEDIEMRDETVHACFTVQEVKRLRMPDLNKEFLQRLGVESEEELRDEFRETLDRQVTYQQRQAVRSQVLEKITESATWELPEELVRKQVENALRREILEMQQAGFSRQEVMARENELRQRAVSTTTQALKEHFVLDKIATKENIEVQPMDIETEIQLMALQQGESPRRIRARMIKSGVIENLEAQIRERKAVDFILQKAKFEDVELPPSAENQVEAVGHAICGQTPTAGPAEDEGESEEAGSPNE